MATPEHELHSWRAGARRLCSLAALSVVVVVAAAEQRALLQTFEYVRVCVLYLLLFSSKLASLARQTQRQRQTANNKREIRAGRFELPSFSVCSVIIVVVTVVFYFHYCYYYFYCALPCVVVAAFQTTLAAAAAKRLCRQKTATKSKAARQQ